MQPVELQKLPVHTKQAHHEQAHPKQLFCDSLARHISQKACAIHRDLFPNLSESNTSPICCEPVMGTANLRFASMQ
jgi:hypothetical protein